MTCKTQVCWHQEMWVPIMAFPFIKCGLRDVIYFLWGHNITCLKGGVGVVTTVFFLRVDVQSLLFLLFCFCIYHETSYLLVNSTNGFSPWHAMTGMNDHKCDVWHKVSVPWETCLPFLLELSMKRLMDSLLWFTYLKNYTIPFWPSLTGFEMIFFIWKSTSKGFQGFSFCIV